MTRILCLALTCCLLAPAEAWSQQAAEPRQQTQQTQTPPPQTQAPAGDLSYPGPTPFPASQVLSGPPIEELMVRAASQVSQGQLGRAMHLYNEILVAAPWYAEAYRQRALTLARLGDLVQAQVDYNRFLELSPESRASAQAELDLLGRSGREAVPATVGAAAPPATAPAAAAAAPAAPAPTTAAYPYSPPASSAAAEPAPPAPPVPPATLTPPVSSGPPLVPAPPTARSPLPALSPAVLADFYHTLAWEALRDGRPGSTLRWARQANQILPQARNHAIMSQALLATRDYRAAATEARAAAVLGPVTDWPTLYGSHGYDVGVFTRYLKQLEEYVQRYPSSSDARFLLGYQYLMMGWEDQAHDQLAIASVLLPTDLVAKELLARAGVEVMVGPQRRPEPSPGLIGRRPGEEPTRR